MASGSALPLARTGAGAPSFGSTYRHLIAAAFAVVLLVAGGASRLDEPQQLLVRLAAVVVIAMSLWPLEFERLRVHVRWMAGVFAAYAVLILQLVPLPPDVWARLPGHLVYADIAQTAGSTGWRPLSMTPDLTVNALLGLLPATAAGLAALYLDTRGRWRLVPWMVGAACASGLLGLVQLAAGGDTLHLFKVGSDDSADGLFANRNHQAAFLACALPLAGAWWRHAAGRWASAAFVGITGFLVVAIVATGSRMGVGLAMIGLVAAFACFASGSRTRQPMSWQRATPFVAAGLVVLAGLASVAARVGLVGRLLELEPASRSRGALIDPFLETVRAFMPWGAGFGSFDSVYRQFEPASQLSTIYMNHAHNEPIELAIEGGLPALVLLATFLWWWLSAAVTILRKGHSGGGRSLALASVAITAMLMLSSLADYPLRTPLLGALFAFACVEMMRTKAVIDAPRG